jgi:hypothetical protein
MKKTILLLVAIALLLPASVFAEGTEFTLGGFVKLEAFWDSTQNTKNMLTPIARNNDLNFQHGRTHFTAQGSRFNFTIKGPKLWGAQVTGFLEMDFDSEQELGVGSANGISASNNYKPRLRHAMFRFNWPETELLLGQYWSMFCEYYPEAAQDGPLQNHGIATARLPQIRITQKFAGDWTVAGLIGDPNVTGINPSPYTIPDNGEASETPQIQGKLQYQKDLWGKAPFYGRPMGFTAQVTAGWQRNTYRPGAVALNTFGDPVFGNFGQIQNYVGVNGWSKDHQNESPWMVQGNLFIPVIPTYSANLAGTASLSFQGYVGQGLEAFGEATGPGSQYYQFVGRDDFIANRLDFNTKLMNRYGGYIQGQYYFSNQWFLNIVYGMDKAYGVSRDRFNTGLAGLSQMSLVGSTADPYRMWQELDATLWYRPITAIKFGLQYTYGRTDYFQQIKNTTNAVPTNFGDEHRVTFVGFFYF